MSNFSSIFLVVTCAHHWALCFTVDDLLHPWCGVHGVIMIGSGYILLLDGYSVICTERRSIYKYRMYSGQTIIQYYLRKFPSFGVFTIFPGNYLGLNICNAMVTRYIPPCSLFLALLKPRHLANPGRGIILLIALRTPYFCRKSTQMHSALYSKPVLILDCS